MLYVQSSVARLHRDWWHSTRDDRVVGGAMPRNLILAVAELLVAVSAIAKDTARATLLIDLIDVRNARRVSPGLIISESLLHQRASYSEQQLAAASARLARLPFLLAVDFALEKGSD